MTEVRCAVMEQRGRGDSEHEVAAADGQTTTWRRSKGQETTARKAAERVLPACCGSPKGQRSAGDREEETCEPEFPTSWYVEASATELRLYFEKKHNRCAFKHRRTVSGRRPDVQVSGCRLDVLESEVLNFTPVDSRFSEPRERRHNKCRAAVVRCVVTSEIQYE